VKVSRKAWATATYVALLFLDGCVLLMFLEVARFVAVHVAPWVGGAVFWASPLVFVGGGYVAASYVLPVLERWEGSSSRVTPLPAGGHTAPKGRRVK